MRIILISASLRPKKVVDKYVVTDLQYESRRLSDTELSMSAPAWSVLTEDRPPMSWMLRESLEQP